MQVVLDSCTLGTIAGWPEAGRTHAIEILSALKARGVQFVMTPHVLGEIGGAMYGSTALGTRILDVAKILCDGSLNVQGKDVIRIELSDPNPFGRITSHGIATFNDLRDMTEVIKHPVVQQFYKDAPAEREQMRTLLDALDPILKGVRRSEIPRFEEYLRERERPTFRSLFDHHKLRLGGAKIGDTSDHDLDKLWQRALALRMMTLILIANEHRKLEKARHNREGCMTDFLIVAESAYSDRVLTNDWALYECGRLANTFVSVPRYVYLPDVLQTPESLVR